MESIPGDQVKTILRTEHLRVSTFKYKGKLVNLPSNTQNQSSVLKSDLKCMVINVFVDIEPSECIKCVGK